MPNIVAGRLTIFDYVNSAEAVADASRAIELDPSISKAYLRKGSDL